MKTINHACLVAALCTLTQVAALAQFDSGSDGSDGALNVTADTTLDLPADGIFHHTTITVDPGVTLRFNRNALNTPVHLLATGAVTISGTIDLSAAAPTTGSESLGGPGGFAGGKPGLTGSSLPPGPGHGPGAGGPQSGVTTQQRAGGGSFGGVRDQVTVNNGPIYGTPLLIPIIGGSGGGGGDGNPGSGGGGGGGALLVASNTSISVTGTIRARGGNFGNNSNTGSGGAIRLVAPEVSGNGTLDVFPNTNHGRIRIDALDRSGINLTFAPLPAATVGVAMIAIPNPLPRLDLIEVADTVIAEGTQTPVNITLPFGADPNRTLVVQARDFGSSVPIRVTLTPEHGTASSFEAVIDNQAANPAQLSVNVTFPWAFRPVCMFGPGELPVVGEPPNPDYSLCIR